jgi:hypothetical protein
MTLNPFETLPTHPCKKQRQKAQVSLHHLPLGSLQRMEILKVCCSDIYITFLTPMGSVTDLLYNFLAPDHCQEEAMFLMK